MSWAAAIVGGSAVIGAGISYAGSRQQSSSANSASRYGKSQMNQARQRYREQFNLIEKSYAPWREAGLEDLADLDRIQEQYEGAIQDPNKYIQSPGYDWLQQQGVSAIDRGAASRGKLDSGQNQKDLVAFGQGLASQDYGNYLARLENLMGTYTRGSQTGFNATSAVAQNRRWSMDADASLRMAKAGMNTAGQIGQANAQTGFYNNLSNIGSNAVNQYMLYNYLQNIGQPNQSTTPAPYASPQPAYGQSNLNQMGY